MSVPFANFSSQDRHKTQGTPAAVHFNPVLSTSLGHKQPQSGYALSRNTHTHTHNMHTHMHGAERNPRALGCLCLLQLIRVSFIRVKL